MGKRKATKPVSAPANQLRDALLLLGEQDDVEGRISTEALIRLAHLGLLTWPEPDTVEFTEAGEKAFERLKRGEDVPELAQA